MDNNQPWWEKEEYRCPHVGDGYCTNRHPICWHYQLYCLKQITEAQFKEQSLKCKWRKGGHRQLEMQL